jgi:hypothetical protein
VLPALFGVVHAAGAGGGGGHASEYPELRQVNHAELGELLPHVSKGASETLRRLLKSVAEAGSGGGGGAGGGAGGKEQRGQMPGLAKTDAAKKNKEMHDTSLVPGAPFCLLY